MIFLRVKNLRIREFLIRGISEIDFVFLLRTSGIQAGLMPLGLASVCVRLNRRIRDHNDVEFLHEPVASFGEGAVAVVHDEFEEVALGTTDKAFEDAFLLAEMQRWMLVIVIGADGSATFIAQASQLETEFVGDVEN